MAACVSGFKWEDINRNGVYDPPIEPALADWNITANFTDGTYSGFSNITDASGVYSICGLDNGTTYKISEILKPGWTASRTDIAIDWVNSSIISQNETIFLNPGNQGDEQLQNYMPPPQTLFGVQSRFGSGNLKPPTEVELYYLTNEIYTDATHTISDTQFQWVSGTEYGFNLTFFENGTVMYTVGNTTVVGDGFSGGRNSRNWPFQTIAIRLRSDHNATRVDMYGMNLTVAGNRYQIENSALNTTYPSDNRETLFIRAQSIMDTYYGGANISQGFTLTGNQKFFFSSAANNKPNVHELEYDILVGRTTFPTVDQQFADLGNYMDEGVLSGQKWNDLNGNGIKDPDESPLPGWFISVRNASLGINKTLFTDSNGEWMTVVPFGNYNVSEYLYSNFNQTYPPGGSHSVALNASVFTGQNFGISDIDFGNQEIPQIGNISGLKFNDFNHDGIYDPISDIAPDDKEMGITGWNITLYYENGTYTGNSRLTDNGSYFFGGLDANQIYIVKEESRAGWYNSTPTQVIADFKNTTEYPNESLVNSGIAIQILPFQNIAFAARSRWGDNATYHQDIEWSPFPVKNSTRISANPHWQNDTVYDFNLTYDPTNNLNPVNYTVSGPPTHGFTTTTIIGPADVNGSRANPMDTIDIYARANVIGQNNISVEVTDLELTVGGTTFPITNNSIALSNVPPSQTHLLVRANRLTGGNITQGFTLTGKQKFIYPSTAVPAISADGFEVTIRAGKDYLSPIDVIEVFGNYQHTGKMEGTKFSDNNGNGVWDVAEGEEPLDNWTFQCYYENGTLFGERTTGIPEPGVWEFYVPYGNYTIKEVNQAGYLPTLRKDGANLTVDDEHVFWEDINFGNQPVKNVTGYKEDPIGNGLPGWTITLSNVNGTPSYTNITDSTGKFIFENVTYGQYWLNETAQPGWFNLTEANLTIIVNGTDPVSSFTFKNGELGKLSGYKRDSGGSGLAGWTIVLENQALGTFINVTNSTGGYEFDSVPWGIFQLGEVNQQGWVQDTPNMTVEINESSTFLGNLNFTNIPLAGNFSGYKLDPTDNGLPGWTINVYYENGTLFGSQLTGEDGSYLFDPVPFGNYTITEILQSGWTQVAPPFGYYEVNMTTGTLENSGLNFTNMLNPRFGNISGIKFNDLNGDGRKDVNDLPLSGWVINLFDQNGTLFATEVTDSNGQFVFDPVPQGLYNLTEVLKDNWTQTAPPSGYYLIEVNGTALNFTLNFGNQEIPDPCSCPTNAFFTWAKTTPAHSIKFTDASTGNPTSWMWSFGDGKFSNVRNPKHTYSKAGTYKVVLSVASCDCAGNTYYTYYSKSIKVT